MKNNKKLIQIYISIVVSIVAVFLLAFAVGSTYYVKSIEAKRAEQRKEMLQRLAEKDKDEQDPSASAEPKPTDVPEREKIPTRTIFGVYGVDKNEALADVIMVASFDKDTKEINVLSIPRDTYVVMPKDRVKALRQQGHGVPYDGGMKINAVHSYAGKWGNEYLTQQLEELLGIDIDYYIEVNLDAFTKIVDDIGGVEIDVPERMYYSDPTQNLLINLKPGKQLLMGNDAQGFVRYRQFLRGDIDRIESQKVFIHELFKQALSKENIVKTIPSLVGTFMDYVDTDMSVLDALKYAPYVNEIDTNKIVMETLPGDGMTPYKHYPEETRKLVDRLFYGIGEEVASPAPSTEPTASPVGTKK